MSKPLDLDFEDFAKRYCETQEQTPEGLLAILKSQIRNYDPDGFMLLRCVMLDSSRLGTRTILPYGPRNTYKAPPDRCISPRGLASDMSEVEALYVLKDTMKDQ